MQNLAWLGVLLDRYIHGLSSRQIRKNAAGNGRRDPKAFQGGDDAVPPKRRGKPGYAGIGIYSVRSCGEHHRNIHLAARHPSIELIVRGGDLALELIRPPN